MAMNRRSFRITYLLLLALRWAFILSPAYIHPDEFFQSAEPAAYLVGFQAQLPWEFATQARLRSWLPPLLLCGLPLKLLSYVSTLPTSMWLLCSVRMLPCVISMVEVRSKATASLVLAPFVCTTTGLPLSATRLGACPAGWCHRCGMCSHWLATPSCAARSRQACSPTAPCFMHQRQRCASADSNRIPVFDPFIPLAPLSLMSKDPFAPLCVRSSWPTLVFSARPFSNVLESAFLSVAIASLASLTPHAAAATARQSLTPARASSAAALAPIPSGPLSARLLIGLGLVAALGTWCRFTFAFYFGPIAAALLRPAALIGVGSSGRLGTARSPRPRPHSPARGIPPTTIPASEVPARGIPPTTIATCGGGSYAWRRNALLLLCGALPAAAACWLIDCYIYGGECFTAPWRWAMPLDPGRGWDGLRLGRDGTGRDAMGWGGMGWVGRDEMGREWMGRDGTGRDGMGWDGTRRMGWDGTRRDGMGWDGMEFGA